MFYMSVLSVVDPVLLKSVGSLVLNMYNEWWML